MKREGEVLIVAALLIISLFFAIPSLALPVDENGNSITNAAVATVDSNGHLEDTSTYIYAETYEGRTDIKTVSLPNATFIGANAFTNCTAMTSVSAPNVTETGNGAFSNCSRLITVNMDRIRKINASTFSSCVALTSVSFPVITSVADYAFQRNTQLITVNAPYLKTIGDYTFNNCEHLNSITLDKVETIGWAAFAGCESLISVNAPMAKSIDYSAFSRCIRLSNVYFPTVERIETDAFFHCTSLTSLVLPKATTFSSNAIDECTALKSLRLDSLQSLGTALPAISLEKIVIPSVTKLGQDVFQYAVNLDTLVIGSGCAETMGNNMIPNDTKLTVYTPNGTQNQVKRKISAGAELYTNVVEYDGFIFKPYLFFSATDGSKCCLKQNAEDVTFTIERNNNKWNVDNNGVVTKGNGGGTVYMQKILNVAGFVGVKVQGVCNAQRYGIVATAPSLSDNSTATMAGDSMRIFTSIYPDIYFSNAFTIYKTDYPTFTFRSYDDEWWEITYGLNTAYLPKPAISTGSVNPTPNPTPGGGDEGGNSGNNTPPVTVINNTNNNIGKTTDDGIKMTLKINGKETEVLLALNNFTYDYSEPETVTATTRFQIRKGPDGVFGDIRSTKKGEKLTIIGRDGRWLKIDMGNGKIGYILEDMTE